MCVAALGMASVFAIYAGLRVLVYCLSERQQNLETSANGS